MTHLVFYRLLGSSEREHNPTVRSQLRRRLQHSQRRWMKEKKDKHEPRRQPFDCDLRAHATQNVCQCAENWQRKRAKHATTSQKWAGCLDTALYLTNTTGASILHCHHVYSVGSDKIYMYMNVCVLDSLYAHQQTLFTSKPNVGDCLSVSVHVWLFVSTCIYINKI